MISEVYANNRGDFVQIKVAFGGGVWIKWELARVGDAWETRGRADAIDAAKRHAPDGYDPGRIALVFEQIEAHAVALAGLNTEIGI